MMDFLATNFNLPTIIGAVIVFGGTGLIVWHSHKHGGVGCDCGGSCHGECGCSGGCNGSCKENAEGSNARGPPHFLSAALWCGLLDME